MEDEELLRNLERDDRYSVIKVLAEREGHSTELVRDPYAHIYIRKRISPELANERAWRTLAQLDSPLLPRVYEIYHLPDSLTVIVAYVEGISASELVDQTGPVSPLTAAGYLHDICPAVALLHAHNLVHRDITPANVVISQGTARLIDLGIARAYDEEATRDTVLLGTWGFAAPEQYGFTQTDARSDIYALGGLLGFLLTGLRPDDQNFETALRNGALVPEELCAIVVRARAFEPSARFQSAEEMDAALRSAIEALCTAQAQRPALPGDTSTNPHAEERSRTRTHTRAQAQPRTQAQTQPREQPTERPVERPAEAPTMPSAPRAEATVPVRRPGKGAKVFSAIIWVLALFFIAAFIHVGFSGQYYKKPIDVLYFKLAGIVGVVTSLAMGLETHKFARSQGRYDIVPQKPHQLGRMLTRRLLVLSGIGFAATLAASIISTIIFSFLP